LNTYQRGKTHMMGFLRRIRSVPLCTPTTFTSHHTTARHSYDCVGRGLAKTSLTLYSHMSSTKLSRTTKEFWSVLLFYSPCTAFATPFFIFNRHWRSFMPE